MFESKQETEERAKLLVNLHRIDPAAAEAIDKSPIEVVRVVLASAKSRQGVVGDLNLSSEGYVEALGRIRLERSGRIRAVVTAPSSPFDGVPDPKKGAALPDKEPAPPQKPGTGGAGRSEADDSGLEAGIDKLAKQTFPDDPKKCAEYATRLRRVLMGGGK